MKKIYSFALAAGFSALACTAANPTPASLSMPEFEIKTLDAKIGGNVTVANSNANGMMKAAANNNAPATLEGLDLAFNWDYIASQTQVYPNSQPLELTLNKTEDGVQYYTSTGFLKGVLVDEVTIKPMELLYEPASGRLMIPAGQTICVYEGNDFIIWNYRDDKFLYKEMNFYFEYKNGIFEWINPMEITDEEGKDDIFTSVSLVIGHAGENGVQAMVQADNLSFRVAQGTMTYTADLIDSQSGQTIPTTVTGPIFAEVSNGKFVVENFGSPNFSWVVPFSVDTNAKTITCERVQVLSEGGIPFFLSSAKNLFNVYEDEGNYKVVAPYTVANGKTTVDVGEWNAFAYDASTKEDVNYFVKFYNTKMVFNMDLNAEFASVGNIAVDEADANAPVEYYNLQGVRVQNPENGLYIRRQGKNVTKVIL